MILGRVPEIALHVQLEDSRVVHEVIDRRDGHGRFGEHLVPGGAGEAAQ